MVIGFIFDFILIKSNKEIYIDCDSSRSSLLYEKLLSYQLRSKIQITIKNNLSVYVIINECNSKFLKMEKKLGFTKFKNQNLCYIDPRNMNLGIRVIGCKKDIKEDEKPCPILSYSYSKAQNEKDIKKCIPCFKNNRVLTPKR